MMKHEKNKTIVMGLRMTVRDKSAIEERARDRNLTVTEYLTRAGLKRPAQQRTDVDAINALRECVDELKAMHARLRGIAVGESPMPDAEMEQTLAAICAVINCVWQPEHDMSFNHPELSPFAAAATAASSETDRLK